MNQTALVTSQRGSDYKTWRVYISVESTVLEEDLWRFCLVTRPLSGKFIYL